MSFNKHASPCLAKKDGTGDLCKNPAMKNSNYCYQHDPGFKERIKVEDNTEWCNSEVALSLPDEKDQELFKNILKELEQDFELTMSSDKMLSRMAAYYFVKWLQSVKEGVLELEAAYDSLLRKSLSSLKVTREKRDGIELKVTTPSVWAAKLIGEYQRRENEILENTNETICNNNNSESIRDSKDSIETVTKKNT